MKTTDPITTLQAYIDAHWMESKQDLRYTQKYWRLLDDVDADRAVAHTFIQHNLLAGSIKDRLLAIDMISSLCNPIEEPQRSQARAFAKLLITASKSEVQLAVLRQIANAFRFMDAKQDVIAATIFLSRNTDEDIRFSATQALGSLATDENQNSGIPDRLIELTKDKDPDVRDWATFNLVNLVEIYDVRNAAIADAFALRVSDRHFDTRSEAIYGLSFFADERGIQPLLTRLKSGKVGTLDIEAAIEYGLPIFRPALLALQAWWDIDQKLLQDALSRCN